jgi:prepilin-type processing-associated H-X9-DG protein
VQKVRAAANNARCRNNLRQIGLALQSYQARMEKFPPAYTSSLASDGSELGPGWGWATHLLDDVEQGTLRKTLSFDLDIANAANASGRQTFIPVFWCPSDEKISKFNVNDENNVFLAEVAQASYVAMNGNYSVSAFPGTNNGAFVRNRSNRIEDIGDGLTTTIFIGERCTRLAWATWTGAVTNGVVASQLTGDPQDEEAASSLVLGHTGTIDDPHLPNAQATGADSFWSNHPSGVNFLYGDGSVRWLSANIQPSVYIALGSRSGGEIISGTDY